MAGRHRKPTRSSYFYRGKHRKPTNTGRRVATVAAAGTLGLGLMSTDAHAGPPGGWGPVIQCESGGNPQAKNPRSSASGLFQFLDGTWRAYGGGEFAPTARQATVEQQHIVAERAYAREGLRPWNASKSCWSGKVGCGDSPRYSPSSPGTGGSSPAPAKRRYDKPAAKPEGQHTGQKPAPAAHGDTYTVRPGDTLSHIAVRFHVDGGWQALWQRNRDVVGDNPHLIFPGQQIVVR